MSLILFEFFDDEGIGSVSLTVPAALRRFRLGAPERLTMAVPAALRRILPPAVGIVQMFAPGVVRLVYAPPRARRVIAEEE